tara:strand:- start:152626 stop:153024 length:399 start_codon:yes stop_codon:yes gene_type:complete
MATDGTDDRKLASHIGARLQALRERSGVSRAAAASALGLSVQAYTNRETGLTEAKAVEILILAGLFDCDPADLFDGADRIWPGPDISVGEAKVFAGEAEDFLRQLARIRDPRLRRSITEAIRALARAAEETA